MRFKLDELLDSLEFLDKKVVKSTREIHRFCSDDPELSQCIKYMMSVSGIGWIVASQLLARIGNWREIKNVRQLAGFLGLVPTEHSTGDRTVGDRSLTPKMVGCVVSSSRRRGRRSAKTASSEIFIIRFAAPMHGTWGRESPLSQWLVSSVRELLWS